MLDSGKKVFLNDRAPDGIEVADRYLAAIDQIISRGHCAIGIL
jgi:hypothetical protein